MAGRNYNLDGTRTFHIYSGVKEVSEETTYFTVFNTSDYDKCIRRRELDESSIAYVGTRTIVNDDDSMNNVKSRINNIRGSPEDCERSLEDIL